MVIAIDAHRLAYMALPKAGCSSVKQALASVDPDVVIPPGREVTHFTWHELYPTRRFRPHRWAEYREYWRFCVVRDPFKRLMSVYTNRVLQFDDLRKSARIREGQGGLTTDPDPDFFFQNLDAYKHASSSIKHHALDAWLFLGPDLGRSSYNRVYRTEDFDALAWDLGLLTRSEVIMPRSNSSEAKLTAAHLSGRTIDALRPFLDREYSYLKDFYINPFGRRIYDACVTPIRRVS